MLPLLAGLAAGGAVKAGINGVQNWVNGQDQEEEARKQALRGLSNRFMKDSTFNVQAPIQEAPGFGETVVAPMATAAASGAAQAAAGGAKGEDGKELPWWQKAARGALGG